MSCTSPHSVGLGREGLWKIIRSWKERPLNESSSKKLKAITSATNMERHEKEASHWQDISTSKLKVWPHLKLDVLASKRVNSRHRLRPFACGASYSYSGWLPSRKVLRCPWMLKFISHNCWAGVCWSVLKFTRGCQCCRGPGRTRSHELQLIQKSPILLKYMQTWWDPDHSPHHYLC